MPSSTSLFPRAARRGALLALATLALAAPAARAAVTSLADQPIFTAVSVPGNVAFALSVEYPTATSIGNGILGYSSATTYYGYFDPGKCYYYNQVTTKTASPSYGSYFSPSATASATDHSCANASTQSLWSGNFLNWASMSTIDGFRWALTGGYRSVDTSTLTILEKSWAPPGQGSASESPPQTTSQTSYANITPFTSWANISTTVYKLGQYMCFTGTGAVSVSHGTVGSAYYTTASGNWSGTLNSATEYASGSTTTAGNVYCTEIRVKVCDPSAATGVESNCAVFPAGNYKPVGLVQSYSQVMRFADFGYLLDSAQSGGVGVRDGGVMRARMKYVGPTMPASAIGSGSVSNSVGEWDANTGVLAASPDSTDVASTLALAGCSGCSVPNSGVINYINMFGEHARYLGHSTGYKGLDNVSELYYTVLRYFKELGNVPEYTALNSYNTNLGNSDCVTAGADQCVDGFPVITNWYPSDSGAPRGADYPIQYSCQKNFVIGIGDANTHQDGNLPGTYAGGGAYLSNPGTDAADEPPLESLVAADTSVDSTAVTNWIGNQEGTINSHTVSSTGLLGQTQLQTYLGCCAGATYYIAGLAYDAHVHDLLPNAFLDVNGTTKSRTQTLSTYWVDVLEYGNYYPQNQYWMAAKYGGFSVPSGYTEFCSPLSGANCTDTTAWPQSIWASQARTVLNAGTSYPVPDNYFSGRDTGAMVAGLQSAFAAIAASTNSSSSSGLSITTSKVNANNNTNYSASYDPADWTGEVQANQLSFDTSGNPIIGSTIWSARTKLAAQLGTLGANYLSARNVVTWNDASATAVAFLSANLSSAETTDLTPAALGATTDQVVAYLRGDQSNEGLKGSALFRARDSLLGDIVDSQVVPVGAPSSPLTPIYNNGYAAFQTTYANRKTVVYFGANDGMLHAFDGSISGTTAGQEMWAYVPGALYGGPTGTPATNGLVARTYKTFNHLNYVDATPAIYDVDFNNGGGSSNTTPDWRTLLIGGLGKGGKSFYAIDITDPSTMTSESAVAGKVRWEFGQSNINAYGSTATIGYSFGQAIVTKTAKYGWVVILSSGYDNSDGKGYLFFLDPKTGTLLEPPLSTGAGSAGTPSGLTHLTTYVPNYADGTSDALYAGDLLGNVWRVDLTATTGNYPTPVRLAVARDASGNAQPITTYPLVLVDPSSLKRYVVFGTGRTLATSDLNNTQTNTIYSVWDGVGTAGGFLASGTLPSGVSFPVSRSNLQSISSLLSGMPGTPSGPMGWYYDLGAATSTTAAEQVDVQAAGDLGVALFGINTAGGSVCDPSGTGRIVAFNIATALTALSDGSGNALGTYQYGNRVITVNLLNFSGTTIGGLVSTSATLTGGGTQTSPTSCTICGVPPINSGSTTPTSLNWREVRGAN